MKEMQSFDVKLCILLFQDRSQQNCEAALKSWTNVELLARCSKYQNYKLDDNVVFKLALNNFEFQLQAG
jgi:hypothetical protein